MTSGYTMLTIGGLVMLMVAVINANRMIVTADVEPATSVQQTVAAALAEELMGEIRARKFDELARDGLVLVPSQFTLDGSLGPDAAEGSSSCPLPDSGSCLSRSVYNDVDDYKGYQRKVNTWESKGYELSAQVYYVAEDDFTTRSYSQTYLKKIVVTVQNLPNLAPITFSTLVGY